MHNSGNTRPICTKQIYFGRAVLGFPAINQRRHLLLHENFYTTESKIIQLGHCYHYTVFVSLAHKDIRHFIYTFKQYLQELTALGIKYVLRSIESSIQVQFLSMSKYTALPLQHTKKHFPSGARVSDLPSKYVKASNLTSENCHLTQFT